MTEKRGAVNRKMVILRDEYSANVKNVHVKARGVEVGCWQATFSGWRHADSPQGLSPAAFALRPSPLGVREKGHGDKRRLPVACGIKQKRSHWLLFHYLPLLKQLRQPVEV
ncbi:MAG TPA: hypothetical protein DDY57_00480 [Franconibacter pulveris]|nr:hypothetical protein [Franconibacter pulveris]